MRVIIRAGRLMWSEGEMGRVDGIAEGRGGEKRFVDLKEVFGFEVFDEE